MSERRRSRSLHAALPRCSPEGDVGAGPLQRLLGALTRLQEFFGHRVAVPPEVPLGVQGVDHAVAGQPDELSVHEVLVALVEDRHVADALQRLLAAVVAVEHARAQLHQAKLGEAVPGTCLVAVAGDLLAPVAGVEDQEAGGCVAHHVGVDLVDRGVPDQLALSTFEHVHAPAVGRLVGARTLKPVVLVFKHGAAGAAQELGDGEVLHAAVFDEPRHVLSCNRGQLDFKLANRKTHDRSEHCIPLSCQGDLAAEFLLLSPV